jgi:hypothetical protein
MNENITTLSTTFSVPAPEYLNYQTKIFPIPPNPHTQQKTSISLPVHPLPIFYDRIFDALRKALYNCGHAGKPSQETTENRSMIKELLYDAKTNVIGNMPGSGSSLPVKRMRERF